jgi:hypothetical protein
MKRILLLTLAGLLALAPGGLPALAAGPNTGQDAGWGAGSGTGTGVPVRDCSYILAGAPFSYSGTISAVGYLNGGGVTLAMDSGSVTVYGLGPSWYWEREGFDWPQVGDALSATGYTVELDGVATNILMTATTMDGKTIQLRDPETACPRWVGARN